MRIIPNLWACLNHLVPGPSCRTFGDDYDSIVWDDVRPQPTYEATLACVGTVGSIMVCSDCCNGVNQIMADKLALGFEYPSASGIIYQINGDAQDSIGKRATYAGWSNADPIAFPWVPPYSLGWWDANNTWHAMTAVEFMLFGKAVSDYVSACAACCRGHKTALETICNNALLTDAEKNAAMDAYLATDALAGWPVNP